MQQAKRDYKQVNLKSDDWQIIKDLALDVETRLHINNPSVPDIIMLCVNYYRSTVKAND